MKPKVDDISDQAVLRYIVGRCGGRAAAAKALGVRPQSIGNWEVRGIAASTRPIIWAWCRSHGLKLSQKWLVRSTRQYELKKQAAR